MHPVRVDFNLAEAVFGHHGGERRDVGGQAGGQSLLLSCIVHQFARSM